MKRADAEHPEYDFVTAGGILVKLKWSDKAREYRAFKNTKYGLEDMKLGSAVPEPLQKYVTENY